MTKIARAIEMFKVENGIVLILVAVALTGIGCERREKRAIISDPIMKKKVRNPDVRWK